MSIGLSRRHWLLGAASSMSLLSASVSGGEDPDALYQSDEIDRAVSRGLDYLVGIQHDSGAITDRGHEIAMTSLGIMAMASLGTQPDDFSQRGKAMNRAIEFVLRDTHQDAQGFYGGRDGSRMYGHGITTLMLTEILGMGATPDQNERIYKSLVGAIKLILAAQRISKSEKLRGGWRYTPSSRDSDLSVSVWQLMALRSAKNDGLDVPGEAIEKALAYLRYSYTSPLGAGRDSQAKGWRFQLYAGTHHPSFTMTAAGLLAMQVCGQYDSPLVEGACEWLFQHPPKQNERFFHYGVYYYAQGMHQAGGKYAELADEVVPELLLPSQRPNGSWLARSGEDAMSAAPTRPRWRS